MSKHKVVIIGGGFGGVKVALELVADPAFSVTLVSDRSDFFIYSMMYRVATGGTVEIANIPLAKLFSDKNIKIINQKVKRLNRKNSSVVTSDGDEVPYDSLVCALGSAENYFGIEGLKERSFSVRSPAAAQKFNRHLHEHLLKAEQTDHNYVVVGAGSTGVELAGSLPSYIQKICKQHGLPKAKVNVTLVEASSKVLPTMPRDISFTVKRRLKRLGVKVLTNRAVQKQTEEGVVVNGKLIKSKTIIWTAGAKTNEFYIKNDFQISPSGKVRVNQFLQAESNIYIIGDNADTPYSGMAQTALYDASFAADNLKKLAAGEDMVPYKAKKPIYVVPAGPNWAAVLWGKFRMYGVIGWWLRRLADFVAYHDYEPWHAAIKRWLAEAKNEEDCRICNPR